MRTICSRIKVPVAVLMFLIISVSAYAQNSSSRVKVLEFWSVLKNRFTVYSKTDQTTAPEVFEDLVRAMEANYLGIYLDNAEQNVLFWAPVGDAIHFITNPPSYYCTHKEAIGMGGSILSELAQVCLGISEHEWEVMNGDVEIRENYNPQIDMILRIKNRNTGEEKTVSYRGNLDK